MEANKIVQLAYWNYHTLHIFFNESIIIGDTLIKRGILCGRKPSKYKFVYSDGRKFNLLTVPKEDVGRYGYQHLCKDCEKRLLKHAKQFGENVITNLLTEGELKMKDKLFTLQIEEYNGEQEYRFNVYIIASNQEKAEQWARNYVKEWYTDNNVIDKNDSTDSLWWTYESWCGSSWNAVSINEIKYLPETIYRADNKENKHRVRLELEKI